MSNVQVKNLDEGTHDALRERAAAEGRTISEYVLGLIRNDLRRPTRAVWLERLRSLPAVPTTTEEVLHIRESGHNE